ncbi:MAG: hypothetical protein Q9217_001130 [Psora testacea]
MEVIVRNLHDQMTEKQVDNYFRPVLERLGTKTYHCQKLRGKGCATLTFFDKVKGQQFLQAHGQTRLGARGFLGPQTALSHLGKPVYCSLSNKEPDEYLVRALKKKESDRYATPQTKKATIIPGKPEIRRPQHSERAVNITAVKCGQWTYVQGDLTFSTCFTQRRLGRIIFGSSYLLVTLQPEGAGLLSHKLVISYNSIHSFTLGATSPSITFSLSEAPKFYENLTGLEAVLQNLSLKNSAPAFKRKRISAISDAHGKIVASCLCYRFLLSGSAEARVVQSLKKFPEIPSSITWETNAEASIYFTAQMTRLNDALAGEKHAAIPFDVKFQLQKLAQNGFLSPIKVVELIYVVEEHLKKNHASTLAGALRHLANRLPYPGPDAEASDFELRTLDLLLCESERCIIEDDPYAFGLADQFDHMILVHKATVTPTGIYLYGPEPEMKNRVLRKYSSFPSYFLSVSFSDEDGEQLRFDRPTSSADIYHVRFKKVLEGVINIAGRGYEVGDPALFLRWN